MGCADFAGLAANFGTIIECAPFNAIIACNMADFIDAGLASLAAVGSAGVVMGTTILARTAEFVAGTAFGAAEIITGFDAFVAENAAVVFADVVDIAIDVAAFFFGLAGFVVVAIFVFGALHAAAVTGGAAESRVFIADFAGTAFRAVTIIHNAGVTVAYFIFKAGQSTTIACIMAFAIEAALICGTHLVAARGSSLNSNTFAIFAFFAVFADIIAAFINAFIIFANLIG